MLENPHPKGCPWHIYAEIFGSPDIKYCEETLCQIISEPANTWSNIPMILVGLIGAIVAGRSKNPWMRSLSLGYLATSLLSFAYHMSNNFLSQVFDYMGMYFFIGLIVVLNFVKLGWLGGEQVTKAYVGGMVLFGLLIYLGRVTDIPFQSTLIVLLPIIWVEIKTIPNEVWARRKMLASAGFMVLAIGSQIIEFNRFFCWPQNHYFQMHMFWHIFNACAVAFYLYFCFSLDSSHYYREKKSV